MISEELRIIIEELEKKGKTRYFEAATENQVVKFEQENKRTLPSKFKEWLLYSDGGELFLPAGIQIYGVEHKPLIDVNDNDRPDESFTVIGTLASGDPILVKNNDEKVFIFDHESQEIDDELIYDDFFALLNDLYDLLGIGE